MRLSEHRRRPSHSSFRRAGGNQLCLQQINSITPPVDLVFLKPVGELWLNDYLGFSIICSPDEVWLEQIAYEAWFVQCYFNLQWDLNPWIHSLVQGAALATCVWGLFHTTILQNSVFVGREGFEPPMLLKKRADLQSASFNHLDTCPNLFHFDAYYGEKCLGYEGERSIVPCMKEPLQLSVAIKDSLQFTTLPI